MRGYVLMVELHTGSTHIQIRQSVSNCIVAMLDAILCYFGPYRNLIWLQIDIPIGYCNKDETSVH